MLMICLNCRAAADAADGRPHDCVDGGRTTGDGRWCDCQHQNTGAPGTWDAEQLRAAVMPIVAATRQLLGRA